MVVESEPFQTAQATVEALLPAWQAADFIRPTLDCLSAQTYRNLTVLVSVDQCDDATFDICKQHAERDPRFRVVRQTERLGYSGNCNFLLERSRADYVMFAFHDDILAPTYVETLAAALDARPQAVLSFSDLDVTQADGRTSHIAYVELDGLESPLDRGHRILMRAGHWWAPNRGLFRRGPAATIGGIKPHRAGEFSVDWPWLFRLSLLGEFVRAPETLCFKFYKPGSISRSWEFSPDQWFEAAASAMRELWNSDLESDEKLVLAARFTNSMIEMHRRRPKANSTSGKVG